MISVLHLSTYDSAGGGAVAASRLHGGLLAREAASKMLVQSRRTAAKEVVERASPVARQLGRARPFLDALPLLPYRKKRVMHWSTGWVPSSIAGEVRAMRPDIVHLHWICHGFVPPEAIGALGRRIVWTMHDSWAFTGGCHVPGECRRYEERCGTCPLLGSGREADLSRRGWQEKERSYGRADITVVAPSRWLAGCAGRSGLLRHRRIEVIPNGLDTALFRPRGKEAARARWNLAGQRKVVLFGAMHAYVDRNKGYHLLLEALGILAGRGWTERAEVLVFGAGEPGEVKETGFRGTSAGIVDGEEPMAALYSAADVVVVPSLQENLPNVVMEALACGTPVVAFGIGGIPEMVDHGVSGYVAREGDAEDLAAGLESILAGDGLRESMSLKARESACGRFDVRDTAGRYLDLYRDLLEAPEMNQRLRAIAAGTGGGTPIRGRGGEGDDPGE